MTDRDLDWISAAQVVSFVNDGPDEILERVRQKARFEERIALAEKLDKIAEQCAAGGHTSRAKMFHAVASETRNKK